MKLPCGAFQMGGSSAPRFSVPGLRAALEEVPSVLCCRGRGKGAGSSAHRASMGTTRTRFSLFSQKSAIYMLCWPRQQIPNRSRSTQAELPCSGFTPCTEAASEVRRRWDLGGDGGAHQPRALGCLCREKGRTSSASHRQGTGLPLQHTPAGSDCLCPC